MDIVRGIETQKETLDQLKQAIPASMFVGEVALLEDAATKVLYNVIDRHLSGVRLLTVIQLTEVLDAMNYATARVSQITAMHLQFARNSQRSIEKKEEALERQKQADFPEDPDNEKGEVIGKGELGPKI